MPIDPRKLRGPAAAFTMSLIVAAYVRSAMQRARFESQARQRERRMEAPPGSKGD
ncbi:hypothetical protein K439DRAFT_727618 [Ramaria rubella]|nr:hypothetical protein K439DRAFT_727618 [Ramaria rubella]